MTFDEAIAIRSRSLQGEAVAKDLLDEAVAVIRAPRPPKKRRHHNARVDALLKLLEANPMELVEFRDKARAHYIATGSTAHAADVALLMLMSKGVMERVVRLTADGQARLKGLG